MATKAAGAVGASGNGNNKLEDVSVLLEKLRIDLKEMNLLPHQRNAALEGIKIQGRNKETAGPIFTKEGIEILAHYGFYSPSSVTAREALRCLANALLLEPKTRQILVDLGHGDILAQRLKTENKEDEFLLSRILFLLTYESNLDFEKLMTEQHLADTINQLIARHSKRFSQNIRRPSMPNPMDDMALSETLKLIFNITHFYPELAGSFSKSIPHILEILYRYRLPTPPLQPPVCYLINALLNLDLEDKKCTHRGENPVFPKVDPNCNAEHLIRILDKAISAYPESELDQVATPVITLIRHIHEFAPEGVKQKMASMLLPTAEERDKPLGKSNTLSGRLLKLSTSALTPSLRSSISALMFELSGKDAASFVQNVGYGFASGFLVSNNIAIPGNATEAWSTNGKDDERIFEINPVTGQRLDTEPADTGPKMTDEEKEREAERLFVLFERLKATGVVDVKNPVQEAIDSGRFEELD